jgi:hypothetical protein
MFSATSATPNVRSPTSRARREARNSKRAFAVANPSPPAPRPRATIAPPGGRSHALREGERGAMTFDGAPQGGEPARTRPSWSRRRARHEPEQSREAAESRGPDPSDRGNVENEGNAENECRVRLPSPARRRARRLCYAGDALARPSRSSSARRGSPPVCTPTSRRRPPQRGHAKTSMANTLSLSEREKCDAKCPQCGGRDLRPLVGPFFSKTSRKS